VIYEAVSDIESALKGLLDPEYKEEILGSAEVREIFHVSKIGVIAGSIVKSGQIKRNAKVRVMRNGELIHDGKISSLKRFKNDVSDVQSGFECGIGVEDFNELQMKDILEVYKLIEIER
ncbi:translation initiation factor IF-2, partial [bacterium]|nr:translation initiation factor IF-2 [bacterium]